MTPQEFDADIDAGFAIFAVILVALFAMLSCCDDEPTEPQGRDDEPEFQLLHGESQSAVYAAARAAAIAEMTARRAGTAVRRPAPPPTTTLPYFPYAHGGASETQTLVCAICLEQLRHGELCSEVPTCHHLFHRDCIGTWIKSSNTCPMCRVKITPGSNLVTVADDMV